MVIESVLAFLESEKHIHDTHGHKTTTSAEHDEKSEEEEQKAESKGIGFTYVGCSVACSYLT